MKFSANMSLGQVVGSVLGAVIMIGAGASAVENYTGDKSIIDETRDLSGFEAVRLEGSMDVFVQAGEEFSVKVVTEERLMEDVITQVRGDTLVIKMRHPKEGGKKYYRNIRRLDVYVTAPSIKTAELMGSGDMELKGLESADLSLILKGSGDMIAKGGVFTTVDAELMGSGDMSLSGSCKDISLDLKGSGDLVAHKMKCANAKVGLRGSGDLSFYASDDADVSLRGSGDIDVFGDPKRIDRRTRGSGDISVR